MPVMRPRTLLTIPFSADHLRLPSSSYAGVAGLVEQFSLRVGDIVNPFMRPAGILIPAEVGRQQLTAAIRSKPG